jgi:hypothetical protein
MSSAGNNGYPRHHPAQTPSIHHASHPPVNSPKHQIHPGRIYELLEALKHEVDGLYEEAKHSKQFQVKCKFV